MNWFEKMALMAAIATTLLVGRLSLNAADLYIEAGHLTRTMMVIGVVGWVIATYGPIALAAWFWRWAKHARLPWALHLLLLPFAFILFRAGAWLILFAIGFPYGDFDDTIGGPVIPGLLLFLITIVGYFTALIFSLVRKLRRPA